MLKHFNQKGRSTVDWAWWRHTTTTQRAPRVGLTLGPAPARTGPGYWYSDTLSNVHDSSMLFIAIFLIFIIIILLKHLHKNVVPRLTEHSDVRGAPRLPTLARAGPGCNAWLGGIFVDVTGWNRCLIVRVQVTWHLTR